MSDPNNKINRSKNDVYNLIQNLKELESKATKGPWTLDHDDTYVAAPAASKLDYDWDWIVGAIGEDEDVRSEKKQDDCRFIAAARNELPKLIQVIEVMREELIRHSRWTVCSDLELDILAIREGSKNALDDADAICGKEMGCSHA